MLPLLVAVALSVGLPATPPAARDSVTAPSPPPEARTASAPAAVLEARWPLGQPSKVVRPFDPPEVRWGAGHRGVDLAGALGQAVRATLGGRVAFAGTVAGTGVVVVDHGGFTTTYQPLRPTVASGATVTVGETIGLLTWPGGHCLPHPCLHWGLRVGSAYRDPLSLLSDRPRPVRLLPLTDRS